jgi:exopolysaccharide biosynthesis polyprenyl glycosylphosphotransferase
MAGWFGLTCNRVARIRYISGGRGREGHVLTAPNRIAGRLPMMDPRHPGAATAPGSAWTPVRLDFLQGGGASEAAGSMHARVRMDRRALAIAVGDALIATTIVGLAVLLRFGDAPIGATDIPYGVLPILIGPVWVTTMWFGGSYDTRYMATGSEEYRRVVNAGIWLLAIVGFTAFAFQTSVSRTLVAIGLPAITFGTLLNRAFGRLILRRRLGSTATLHRTVVLGDRDDSAALVRHMRGAPHVGFAVVGVYLPCSAGDAPRRVLGDSEEITGPEELVASVRSLNADTIAVTHAAAFGSGQLRRLSWALEGTGIELLVAPSLTDVAGPRIVVRPVQGLPLLHIEEPEFHGAKRLLKAAIDRVLGTLALVLALPIMLVTAIAIKVSDAGPIFYRQVRVGRLGAVFVIWKFRTMNTDAEARHAALMAEAAHDGVLFKLADDPRVTKVGRFLRRYSIDELPQLLNVLGGSMSLVGPRPQRPLEVALYADDARRRLLVKPGMTGLWQVSGRNSLSWEEALQLDLHYVDNWSVTRDLVILAKTAWTVLRAPGAF